MDDPVGKIKIYLNRVSIKISNKLYTLKELMNELGYKNIEKIECSYVSQDKIFTFDNPYQLVPLEENMNIIINKELKYKSFESQKHKLEMNRIIPEAYKPKIPDYVLDKVGSKGGWAVGNDKKHKEIEKSERVYNSDSKLLSKRNEVWIPVNHGVKLYKIPVGMTTIKDIREKCNIDDNKRIIYSTNIIDIHIPCGDDSAIYVNETLRLFTFDKILSEKKCIKSVKIEMEIFNENLGTKLPLYEFIIENTEYCTWYSEMTYSQFYTYFIEEDVRTLHIKSLDIRFRDNTKDNIVIPTKCRTWVGGIYVDADDIKLEDKSLDMENLHSVSMRTWKSDGSNIMKKGKNKIIINGKIYKTNKEVITRDDIIELYNGGDETYNVAFYNRDTNRIEDLSDLSLDIDNKRHRIKPIFYISKEEISSYSFTVNGKCGYLPFRHVSIQMVATELRHIYPDYYHPLDHPVKIILNEDSKFLYIPLDKEIPVVLYNRGNDDSYDIDILVNDKFYFI